MAFSKVRSMKIQITDGATAASIVESHYQKNNFPRVKVRPTDMLFIATDDQAKILGCFRYCIEEGVPLLRTMAVDQPLRKQGIGKALLLRFQKYLDAEGIRGAHLICSCRLNPFYAQIGFKKIEFSEAPLFLQERMRKYDPELSKMTCMKRP